MEPSILNVRPYALVNFIVDHGKTHHVRYDDKFCDCVCVRSRSVPSQRGCCGCCGGPQTIGPVAAVAAVAAVAKDLRPSGLGLSHVITMTLKCLLMDWTSSTHHRGLKLIGPARP